MKEEQIIGSPYATEDHQEICMQLLVALRRKFGRKYKVHSPGLIDPTDADSLVPDIVGYKKTPRGSRAVFLIEVCTPNGERRDKTKIERMMSLYPELQEAFRYNYHTRTWHLLDRENDWQETSESDLLGVDLNAYIE